MKNYKLKETLIEKDIVAAKVRELAELIERDFAGEEVTVIGVLKGCFIFMADIVRALKLSTEVYFMEVSSYGSSTESTGNVKIMKDIDVSVKDKNILIIEDIVDSGFTLKFIKNLLLEREAKVIKICTLLNKPSRRTADISIDYIGFNIPDEFVVGYGLDFNEKYRNLSSICTLEEIV